MNVVLNSADSITTEKSAKVTPLMTHPAVSEVQLDNKILKYSLWLLVILCTQGDVNIPVSF